MAASEKIFALFPGQGSQRVGMGKELVEKYSTAADLFKTADEVLGFSLSSICFDGPPEKLTATAIAQPAILTVSTIYYKLFIENGESGVVAAAGHSLGEYSALVAAGALKFEDAVLLVHKRGRYMQEAVPQGAGKMVAVLGKDLSEIEAAISEVQHGVVQVANINAPGQIVVAGDLTGVDAFVSALEGAKIRELQVSAPFHCKLMQPAAEKLAVDLDNTEIKEAAFPVYSNFLARPLQEPDSIRQALKDQVCGTVRWVECVENAINAFQPTRAIEFGEGKVLTGMLKRIAKNLSAEPYKPANETQ